MAARSTEYDIVVGLLSKYERQRAGELAQVGANLKSLPICSAMAFVTYDVRLGGLKLHPHEALKV